MSGDMQIHLCKKIYSVKVTMSWDTKGVIHMFEQGWTVNTAVFTEENEALKLPLTRSDHNFRTDMFVVSKSDSEYAELMTICHPPVRAAKH